MTMERLMEMGEVSASDRKHIRRLRGKIDRRWRFPENTDPCLRHLLMMAEALGSGGPYPMLDEEPGHCAVTMLSVVQSLLDVRNELHRLTGDYNTAAERRATERWRATFTPPSSSPSASENTPAG